jgi:hypothetical protein
MPTRTTPDIASIERRLQGRRPPVSVSTAQLFVTREHQEIQRWAAAHYAEPATGEATGSGPALMDVNDGGAGIRFNFPGFARFRPISWDEWFDNFERHDLLFVYEAEDRQQVASYAHELWQRRGGGTGDDRADWFKAEADLRKAAGGGSPAVRYWLLKNDETS